METQGKGRFRSGASCQDRTDDRRFTKPLLYAASSTAQVVWLHVTSYNLNNYG